jgi:hypothetical protein
MLESHAELQTLAPGAPADVLTTLTSLITDIRRVLIDPEAGNAQKLLALHALIDTAAAPPPAATLPAGRPGG